MTPGFVSRFVRGLNRHMLKIYISQQRLKRNSLLVER